jgi:hypothetical protein
LISFPLNDELGADPLMSLSPSLSAPFGTPGGGVAADSGGFIIMAWVITLLTALIELMLSSPVGKQHFAA